MDVIEIVRAQPKDVASIYEIQIECSLSLWTLSDYEAELKRSDAMVLVASKGPNYIAGFLTGRVLPGSIRPEPVAEIYNLGVLAEYRQQRIGSSLLNRFVTISKSQGVAEINLEVRASNHVAIRFYKANGFKKIATRPNFYTDPAEDAETMSLALDAGFRL